MPTMELTGAPSRLENLDWNECLRLVAEEEVGRLGVVDGYHPMIFPVNYVLDGERVVFRTDPGSKLRSFGQDVCFEVDSFDRETRTGWSVVIKGQLDEALEFDRPELVDRIRSLPVTPWAGGEKGHWMWIRPVSVTGRRITSADGVR